MSDNSHNELMIAEEARYTQYLQQRPCVILKPRLFQDGNQWCVLYGDNLQIGLSGFGETPAKAMADFDENYNNKRAITPQG